MQECIVFLVRVQCRCKESSRSLSHLLMSFLLNLSGSSNAMIIIIIIITAICIAQNRLRATNALSGSSSTVTVNDAAITVH